MRGVAERISRDRVLEPDDAGDVAGGRLGDLLAIVGPDVVEPRTDFLLVLARIVNPAARLEPARVDPHEREVAVRVAGDLEDKPAERFVGARLTRDLCPLLGMMARDGGPVQWTGQEGGDGVQQPLNADVTQARTTQDRMSLPGQGHAPQRGDDITGRKVATLQVGNENLRRSE